MDNHKLRYGITIVTLLIALVHLMWPTLSIDAITLVLLFIALIPWLSPVFKSLEFPGGWKIEFQEFKEKMETIIAKETEPVEEAAGPRFSVKAFLVNDEAMRLVLKALGNPRYTWRYIGGLINETKLPAKEVLRSIDWFLENKLITESKIRDRRQWALSQDGRDLFNSIFGQEEPFKGT